MAVGEPAQAVEHHGHLEGHSENLRKGEHSRANTQVGISMLGALPPHSQISWKAGK